MTRLPQAALASSFLWLAVSIAGFAEADPELRKIDLKNARIFASHATEGDEFKIEDAIDGNSSTKWVGEGHPLPWQATNVVLQFENDEPVTIERVVLLTQSLREVLALKSFEIYARAAEGDGWAGADPLVAVTDAKQLRIVIDFPPTTTHGLRIRIRDTWRSDHAFPRLAEIEIYGPQTPPALLPPRLLKAAPVPGEKQSERLLLARAMGQPVVFPGEQFDATKGYIHYARRFLDTLIQEGTDRYGAETSPMFAAILDMETHTLPLDPPANIPGQRFGDRALHGGNLHHDIMLLAAADSISDLTGDRKYREAATAYLKFFLQHCPGKATGLFPWGEHAYWDFHKEAPGPLTHEFLGGIPSRAWERMWEIHPGAIRAQADGLINHIVNLQSFAFDRHARIDTALPVPRPRGLGYLDFPRHAGFYIGTWTFAHHKTGDQKYLDWSLKLLDHHWRSRHPASGLLPVCTHGRRAQQSSSESMLSLAVSLLESARLLPPGEPRRRYESAGKALAATVLEFPHRAADGQIVLSAPIATPPGDVPIEASALSRPFQYRYGGGFTADYALLLLAVHRLTGNQDALAIGNAISDYYRKHDPPPPTEIVRAHVYASIIGLFLDLHELEDEERHLAQAERYARLAIERLFYRGLFRGATGINHYESEMMVGNLIYNLTRLHALKTSSPVKIPPNTFNR